MRPSSSAVFVVGAGPAGLAVCAALTAGGGWSAAGRAVLAALS